MRATCTKVEEIEIGITSDNGRVIRIDGIALDASERESLARLDGFKTFSEMMAFWDGRVPFKGHIVHWRRRGAR